MAIVSISLAQDDIQIISEETLGQELQFSSSADTIDQLGATPPNTACTSRDPRDCGEWYLDDLWTVFTIMAMLSSAILFLAGLVASIRWWRK